LAIAIEAETAMEIMRYQEIRVVINGPSQRERGITDIGDGL